MPQIVHHAGQDLTAFAFESVTVSDTAGGLTAATYNPAANGRAQRAYITVETAQIRYRLDGTDPTASVGHILEVGDILIIDGNANIANANFIRTGGTSGTIRVTYERFRLPS